MILGGEYWVIWNWGRMNLIQWLLCEVKLAMAVKKDLVTTDKKNIFQVTYSEE